MRGTLLIALELTVIRFLWTFNLDYAHYVLLGVIWMLGACMVLLGLMVSWPTRRLVRFKFACRCAATFGPCHARQHPKRSSRVWVWTPCAFATVRWLGDDGAWCISLCCFPGVRAYTPTPPRSGTPPQLGAVDGSWCAWHLRASDVQPRLRHYSSHLLGVHGAALCPTRRLVVAGLVIVGLQQLIGVAFRAFPGAVRVSVRPFRILCSAVSRR
ncbi:MAG: hypothetical protein U0163_14175 [Gemmatimonadaceae bacterium]